VPQQLTTSGNFATGFFKLKEVKIMTTTEVIEALKKLGSEKSRQPYIKQGAGDNQFEVQRKFAHFQKRLKRIIYSQWIYGKRVIPMQ
jgi:hypothetical protein